MLRTNTGYLNFGKSLNDPNISVNDVKTTTISVTDSISLPDNGKLKLGDGDDTEVYFDGTDTIIESLNKVIKVNTRLIEHTNTTAAGYAQLLMRGPNGAFITLASPSDETNTDTRLEHAFNQTVLKSNEGNLILQNNTASNSIILKASTNEMLRCNNNGEVILKRPTTGSDALSTQANGVFITDPSGANLPILGLSHDSGSNYQLSFLTSSATGSRISSKNGLEIDPDSGAAGSLYLVLKNLPAGTSDPAGAPSGTVWRHSSNGTLHIVP